MGASLRYPGLLPLPGGFEGVALTSKHPNPNNLRVTDFADLEDRWGFDPDAAAGSLPANPEGGDDVAVAYWHALLEMQPKALKRVLPGLPELPDLLTATVGPGVGEGLVRVPLDLWVHPLEGGVEVIVERGERLKNNFHVLLRVHLRSIS